MHSGNLLYTLYDDKKNFFFLVFEDFDLEDEAEEKEKDKTIKKEQSNNQDQKNLNIRKVCVLFFFSFRLSSELFIFYLLKQPITTYNI